MFGVTDFQFGHSSKVDQKNFLQVVSLGAFELAAHGQCGTSQFIDALGRCQSGFCLYGGFEYENSPIIGIFGDFH